MLLDEFLREHRDRCGLTHRRISHALASKGHPTHENAVGRWMNGITKPSPSRFGPLLAVLGVTAPEDIRRAYRMRWPAVADVLAPEASP